MNRRRFLHTSLMGTAVAAMAHNTGGATSPQEGPQAHVPELTCYYLLAHAYTCVPRHIAEDFSWMRDAGVSRVAISVLEQDPEHSPHNLDHLFTQAQRMGLQLIAIPSRWGGLVAGAPKVPSAYAASHFHTLVHRPDGQIYASPSFGPMCSIYHPDTLVFMKDMLRAVLKWPFSAVTWDEIKAYERPDYSPAAQAALGTDPGREQRHYAAVSAFFGELNKAIAALRPGTRTMAMLYANSGTAILSQAAQMPHLDYLGTDGRPWHATDGGTDEQHGKVLLGGPGQLTLDLAAQHGKKSYCLIENHNLATADYALLDRRLPEVLRLGFDQIMFYYYPRNLERPEETMAIFQKHLKALQN